MNQRTRKARRRGQTESYDTDVVIRVVGESGIQWLVPFMLPLNPNDFKVGDRLKVKITKLEPKP